MTKKQFMDFLEKTGRTDIVGRINNNIEIETAFLLEDIMNTESHMEFQIVSSGVKIDIILNNNGLKKDLIKITK